MKYNKNLAGIQITDERIFRTNSASARLAHDTILASTVVIRTAPSGGGTLLTLTTDYTLNNEDSRLTTEAGATVNTTVAIVNGAYHNTTLYISYKTVGDYAEAEDTLPAGSMTMFAGSVVPTGWLLCDGSAVSRATYFDLFESIGTTWGSGNGTTTFNLPDMRGAAPAGVGTSTGYTQNETLELGTKYNDQMHGHLHNSANGVPSGGAQINVPFTLTSTTPANIFAYTIPTNVPMTDGTNGTPRTGNVTRGKRVGVNFIIKT